MPVKSIFKISFFLAFFLLWPVAMSANNVVINEIAWMGSKIEGVDSKNWSQYEWVELYNNSEQEADLAGWQIENILSKNGTLEIVAGVAPPRGHSLICKKEMAGCDLVEPKLSLHNEYNKNGKLILKNSSGAVIDATPEPEDKAWPGGDNETKQTMEWTGSAWQTSQNPGGTPKARNSNALPPTLPEPEQSEKSEESEVLQQSDLSDLSNLSDKSPPEPEPAPQIIEYPKNIFINEILPSPEGADSENEWIELYNANGFEIDLSGWQIRDTTGAVRTYTCPTDTPIVPLGFLVLSRPQTKITLQNSGDGLELLNPNQEVVDTLGFSKAPQAQSYNRTENGWQWSTVLTPEKQNIIAKPTALAESEPSTKSEGPGREAAINMATKTDILSANVEKTLPKTSGRILTFIFAVIIAVGSAVIVLFLKRKNPEQN